MSFCSHFLFILTLYSLYALFSQKANDRVCTYLAMPIARYQKCISGPLLDRIDIHVEVPRVDYEKLADKRQAETSATIRCPSSAHQAASALDGRRQTGAAESYP